MVIKYLKCVIQANAASAVDQLKVAQDRTLAPIVHVFIAQLRNARRAPWITNVVTYRYLKSGIWLLRHYASAHPYAAPQDNQCEWHT